MREQGKGSFFAYRLPHQLAPPFPPTWPGALVLVSASPPVRDHCWAESEGRHRAASSGTLKSLVTARARPWTLRGGAEGAQTLGQRGGHGPPPVLGVEKSAVNTPCGQYPRPVGSLHRSRSLTYCSEMSSIVEDWSRRLTRNTALSGYSASAA